MSYTKHKEQTKGDPVARTVVTAFNLQAAVPTANRIYYVNDETAVRTVSFTYADPGTKTVECSSDGGTNFGSCTTANSLVWSVANYNQQHIVRLNAPGLVQETYSFTPSAVLPGLTFLACNVEVSADEDFNTFETTRVNASRTICISNGVKISNSGAQDRIVFGANNITVIAREGQTGTIESTRSSASVPNDSGIYLFANSGIKLIGLTVTVAGAGNALSVAASTASIYSSSLTSSGTEYTVAGGSDITFVNSTIRQTGTGVEVIRAYTGNYTITGSTLISDAAIVFYSWGGTQIFSNSTFQSNYALKTRKTLEFADGTTATLNNNTIIDAAGGGHLYISNGGGETTTVELNGNTFKILASASPVGGTYALAAQIAGGVRTLNSTTNGNSFCHWDPGQTFTGIKDGNYSGGTFDVNNQVSAVFVQCE